MRNWIIILYCNKNKI